VIFRIGVEDAHGLRQGFINGEEWDEIPNATYWIDDYADNETGELMGMRAEFLSFLHPAAEAYKVYLASQTGGAVSIDVTARHGLRKPKAVGRGGCPRQSCCRRVQNRYDPSVEAALRYQQH